MRKWILAILVACAGCCSIAKAQTEFTIQEFILFPDTHVVIQPAKPKPIPKAVPIVEPKSLQVIRQITQAPITIPKKSNVAHWSYPGDITTHLLMTHGQATSGMSHEQQLNLHDSLHTQTTQSRSTSNCPGGVCPQQSSYSVPRLRLFGRIR